MLSRSLSLARSLALVYALLTRQPARSLYTQGGRVISNAEALSVAAVTPSLSTDQVQGLGFRV